jgi:DUF1009 family protein
VDSVAKIELKISKLKQQREELQREIREVNNQLEQQKTQHKAQSLNQIAKVVKLVKADNIERVTFTGALLTIQDMLRDAITAENCRKRGEAFLAQNQRSKTKE